MIPNTRKGVELSKIGFYLDSPVTDITVGARYWRIHSVASKTRRSEVCPGGGRKANHLTDALVPL